MQPIDTRPDLILQGTYVRLEPLAHAHVASLWEVVNDPEIWRWTSSITSRDDLERYVDAALEARAAGSAVPFATIDRTSGRPVGSTRFGSIERDHRRVEIGWTWIARAWQRTALNTEAKYLMLRHAFETWGCNRVELKTDALNERSRNAIRRIGAVEEGILRHHMVCDDGRLRDSVYYSILAGEWPGVKARLELLMSRTSSSH